MKTTHYITQLAVSLCILWSSLFGLAQAQLMDKDDPYDRPMEEIVVYLTKILPLVDICLIALL